MWLVELEPTLIITECKMENETKERGKLRASVSLEKLLKDGVLSCVIYWHFRYRSYIRSYGWMIHVWMVTKWKGIGRLWSCANQGTIPALPVGTEENQDKPQDRRFSRRDSTRPPFEQLYSVASSSVYSVRLTFRGPIWTASSPSSRIGVRLFLLQRVHVKNAVIFLLLW
jgi:hypothetical protein